MTNFFKSAEQTFAGGLPIEFYSSTEGGTSKATVTEDYVDIDNIGFWTYDNVKTAFEYYYTGNNFTIVSMNLQPYNLDYATFNKVYAFLPQGTNIQSIYINGYDIEIIKVRPLHTQHSGGGAVDG